MIPRELIPWLLILAIIVSWFISEFVRWRVRRGKEKIGVFYMSERRLVSDGFYELIDKLVREKKLSEQRADWYYRQACIYLGLDVLPEPAKGEKLKRAIRERLGPHYHDILFRPVPFPDRRWHLDEILGQGKPWRD